MRTRIGSSPGPEWMRKLGDSMQDPRAFRRKMMWIFVFFGTLQFGSIIVADFALYRARGEHVRSYNSGMKIAGLPLLSVGGRARGIIAYGGLATGFIAIGGVAAGFISFGGLSVGVFAFGGLSAGVIALGGVALGWRAIGGVAVGNAAVGAVAIGRYAYAGSGVALGRDEASGKQKESLIE